MTDSDIVISGFSGRFPQADHVIEFKEKLYANVDFVTSDEARYPKGFLGLPYRMGTIRDLSRFDSQMFHVNPKQAHLMDPQMRLLLETSYEAIMDAGYDPDTLESRNVGVFIGCSACDSIESFSVNTDKMDGYELMGTNRAMFSNRISYAFDFTANGYVRSETVGAFFVQQARDARRIYCKVAHVKITADGYKSEGISTPSATLQEKLLREVYSEAKIDPSHVLYLEAHGTGTKVGDPTELAAASSVFCKAERRKPLKIGSVKSNLGHSEAASGFCSLAKVILAMETGIIAGNLHFHQPNPDIPSLRDGTIEIVDKATPFLSGPRTIDCIEKEGPYPDSGYALLNIVGQRSVAQFPHRGYMLVPVDGTGKEAIQATTETLSTKRPVWFVFTGMGCQWRGMTQQMMQFDVFARSIQRSHELLKEVGMDLIDLLTSTNDEGAVGPLYGCILAVQVALVDVLLSLGIKPDGMVGHSFGEVGCAYADGCLTAEESVLCAYWRGRCVDTGNLPPGAMAAVGMTWEEATRRCPDGVQPACHNAEDSVTVSGAADAVAKWVEELRADGVFVRDVNSAGVAFHSKYMESIRPACIQAMQKSVLKRSVGPDATCLGLMKRDANNVNFFLNSLGQLHSLGVQFDPSPLYPPVPLPVPRGTPNIGHLVSWDHSQQWTVVKWNDFPTLDKLSEEVVEIDVDDLEGDAYLAGHQLQGRVVFPATGYIVMVWKSLAKRLGRPFEELPVVLEDLEFHRLVIPPKTGSARFLVNVMRASGEFEISERGTVVASGTIRAAYEKETILDAESLNSPTDTLTYDLDAEDVYKELRLRGYEYHGPFLGILKADIHSKFHNDFYD
ncbi:hypothetical protein MTO96_051117 [Rhipicephalus appendiculatus]